MTILDPKDLNADTVTLAAPDTIRVERVLNAPIAKVWSYLVDSEKRAKWFAGGPFELRVGGKTELRFHHDALSSERSPEGWRMDGSVPFYGVITAYEPERVLAWRDEDIGQGGSDIRFELSAEGAKTRMIITHRSASRGSRVGVSSGWTAHLNILEDVMAAREPRGFWSAHRALEAYFDALYPQ